MFRIYLRDQHQQVSEKTTTGDVRAAIVAFESLVNRSELDGQPVLVAITQDGSPIAHHKFTARPGDSMHYWRGRIGELPIRVT